MDLSVAAVYHDWYLHVHQGLIVGRRGRTTGGPLACVLGEIDLVRALHLGGISSVVVGARDEPARYSRAAVAALEPVDSLRHGDDAVERLLAFARTQAEPPVLYFDSDWDLLLVSRRRDALTTGFRFVIADPVLVEDLVDKSRFQTLAVRLGLPVPRGRRLRTDDDADPGLEFPLIAKPLTRHHDTWRPLSSAKAVLVETPAKLRRLRANLEGRHVELFIQEAIAGPESAIESYHVYVDYNGAIAGEFTGRKLRTFPSRYGYSTALTTTGSPDVRALGREVVDRLGLRGVAKLDFKRIPGGGLTLLEVNPRFNLWHHPGALAGVNLPAMVYADLVGLPRPAVAEARAGVQWCSLAHDLRAARATGMTSVAWLRWMLACEAKSGFAWDDPLPLPRAAIRRLKRQPESGSALQGRDGELGAQRAVGAGGEPM
jgi:D-aspartate ligase